MRGLEQQPVTCKAVKATSVYLFFVIAAQPARGRGARREASEVYKMGVGLR